MLSDELKQIASGGPKGRQKLYECTKCKGLIPYFQNLYCFEAHFSKECEPEHGKQVVKEQRKWQASQGRG